MTKFRDLPAAQFGRYGETIAARLLRNGGYGVIATFKFSGENDNEAPAIEFHDKRITLADLDVSLRGRTFSVEIKTYGEPAWNTTHRCKVHGIPVRLFGEYVDSEMERGIPVHLGVLEVNSGVLLVSNDPISSMTPRYPCGCHNLCESVRLSECEYRQKWGNSYPQWYFRRDSFREWHRLDGNGLKKLQAEHARVRGSLKKPQPHHRPQSNVFESPPWTWACMPCNTTGVGDASKHRCAPNTPSYMREFWTQRLRAVRPITDGPHLTLDEISVALSRPVSRVQLVAWLGQQWGVAA